LVKHIPVFSSSSILDTTTVATEVALTEGGVFNGLVVLFSHAQKTRAGFFEHALVVRHSLIHDPGRQVGVCFHHTLELGLVSGYTHSPVNFVRLRFDLRVDTH
jgi:hypothetical protein